MNDKKQAQIQPENEYQTRLQRRNQMLSQHLSPYPTTAARTTVVSSVIAGFSALVESKQSHTLAGRLRTIRRHGASTFVDLHDESGKIQIFFRKDVLGDATYDLVKNLLDIGDIIEVTGSAFATQQGEPTLLATTARILTKAVRPLPDKWAGLTDPEARARKRYLDFIANPRSKEIIVERSKIVAALRSFAHGKGYIEVETPELQTIYGGGFARPFKTHHNALDIDLYLRISDELFLKRMLVGGFEKIFEVCRDFRNEGIDQTHNPEFTMVEFMTAYQDYTYSMDLVEEIYEHIAQAVFAKLEFDYQGTIVSLARPWRRVPFFQAVSDALGKELTPETSVSEARTLALASALPADKKKELEQLATTGEIAGMLFEELVEKTLLQPTIVYEYPVELSPLAKQSPKNPLLVERFEHFIGGVEHGNHYSELNDPVELRRRFIEEKKKEAAGFEEAHQTDDDFVEAMEYGMPPATGIGIGIDRMVMLMTGAKGIREAVSFPTVRPLGKNQDS